MSAMLLLVAALPSGHAGITVKLQVVADLADINPGEFVDAREMKQIETALADAKRLAGS